MKAIASSFKPGASTIVEPILHEVKQLMDLPTEIRLEIFHHLTINTKVTPIEWRYLHTSTPSLTKHSFNYDPHFENCKMLLAKDHPVLHTCSILRSEYHDSLCSNAIFSIHAGHSLLASSQFSFSTRGISPTALKRIHIFLEGPLSRMLLSYLGQESNPPENGISRFLKRIGYYDLEKGLHLWPYVKTLSVTWAYPYWHSVPFHSRPPNRLFKALEGEGQSVIRDVFPNIETVVIDLRDGNEREKHQLASWRRVDNIWKETQTIEPVR